MADAPAGPIWPPCRTRNLAQIDALRPVLEPGGFLSTRPARWIARSRPRALRPARPGHRAVLASGETLALMRTRMATPGGRVAAGARAGASGCASAMWRCGWSRPGTCFFRAGGECARSAATTSARPTHDAWGSCLSLCHVFVTEAETFALPVFRHPSATVCPVAGEHKSISGADACGRLLFARQMPAADHAAAGSRLGPADFSPWRARCALRDLRSARRGARRSAAGDGGGRETGRGDRLAPLRGRGPLGAAARGAVVFAASGWMAGCASAPRRAALQLPLVISDHADCYARTRRSTRSARRKCG